jgi:hypothetical protein
LSLQLKFRILPERLAVCRLEADHPIPAWALKGALFALVRASDEFSVVCEEGRIPDGIRAEKDWVALRLEGPFPFSLTGVLVAFLEPLAEAKIPIFAISTFDTDYVLVKNEDTARAVKVLTAAGHEED